MKTIKRVVSLTAIMAITLLGACNGDPSTPTSSVAPTSSSAQTSSAPASSAASSSQKESSSPEEEAEFYVEFKGEEYDSDATVTATLGDNTALLTCTMADDSDSKFTFTPSDATMITVDSTGKVSFLKAGTAKVVIKDESGASITLTFVITEASIATGGHTYATVSYDEKSRILASLEKYAVDNYLTGITIFSNGSKIAYNTRYVPQASEYITGYGWGTTREGKFTANLTNSLSGKNSYYNVGTTSLPPHANAMNATGSDVSTVYEYIANAYYATRMNEAKDGYEWYPSMATDEHPIAVAEPKELNADGSVKTPGDALPDTDAHYNNNKRWRIHLRNDIKYRSNSTESVSASYEGKNVALEDYLTPIKFMLTSWNGQYRGSELTDGVSGFKGAASYFAATSSRSSQDAADSLWNDEKWNSMMGDNIYTGHDDGGDFIEFNLLSNCTQFYAMYYLSSSLYSPLPEAFIKHWGSSLGKNVSGTSYCPKDTMLSTGPYYIEDWKNGEVINFKKNDQYFWKQDKWTKMVNGASVTTTRDVYNIDGVSYNAVEDSSTLKPKFLAGQLDSYAPTADDLKSTGDFATEDGTGTGMSWHLYKTKGDSNFKLNVNAVNEDDWKERFGPIGSIYQHNAGDYTTETWKALNNHETGVKPYMSNVHFLNFLSFAINRKEICEARGSTPTQEYLSDNYLIDPEKGVSYNSTEAHKAVLADRHNDTFGYDYDYAREELIKAIDDENNGIMALADEGAFNSESGGSNAGTKKNPWVVPIDMEWMNTTDSTDYSDVFKYVRQIFSEVSSTEYNGMFKLDLQETSGNANYEEVYNLMRRGEFDLGFGSITGDSLNPINFLEVLKSDNSSGFTLNWGPDTSKVGDGIYSGTEESKNHIYYDGKEWSFDALWQASVMGTVLDNSGNVAGVRNASTKTTVGTYKYESISKTDKTVTYKLSFKQLIEAGATNIRMNIKNSSGHSEAYSVGFEEENLVQISLDANDEYELTLAAAFNSDGTTDYYNVTVSVEYDANLKDADGNNISTESISSTLTLLTYMGVMHNS